MDVNKWISALTFAGLFGLVILNATGSVSVIQGIGGVATDYVKTVQGRG